MEASGKIVWPVTLRRKLGLPPSANNSSIAAKSDGKGNQSTSSLLHQNNQPQTKLSTHQLRHYIHSSYEALTSIQRQLHRGEESYFEETYAHGNFFAGFDNIWIENPNSGSIQTVLDPSNASLSSGGTNNNNSANQVKHVSTRKMPNDFRWFSSSNITLAVGDGKIAELGRPSLMDRPPTPEIKEDDKKKEIVVGSGEKPNFDANTKDAEESQAHDVMEVDASTEDSTAKSQDEQAQNNVTTLPLNEESMQVEKEKEVPSQKNEQIKDEKGGENDDQSNVVAPVAEDKENTVDMAESAASPTEQADVSTKTESKHDTDNSNDEQKDESTKDAQASDNKNAQSAADKMEQQDVEMVKEDKPSQSLVKQEEMKSDTEEQLPTKSTSEETHPPAKVPKRSIQDTPNRATKTAAENSVAKEEKDKKSTEKPGEAQKAAVENKEATDKEEHKHKATKAKPEAKAKAPPARRATRRTTRKRKAS